MASQIIDQTSIEELGSEFDTHFGPLPNTADTGQFILTNLPVFDAALLPSPSLYKPVSWPIVRILQVLDTPLIAKHDYWELEDPDLMPTYDDFQCVHGFITSNPLAAILLTAMDSQGFMTTFFLQPAPL
ncbi:hypothetical protein HDU99_000103, partial [Rhizoclosmatium hyalinum]